LADLEDLYLQNPMAGKNEIDPYRANSAETWTLAAWLKCAGLHDCPQVATDGLPVLVMRNASDERCVALAKYRVAPRYPSEFKILTEKMTICHHGTIISIQMSIQV
jgi:hypothetical protein